MYDEMLGEIFASDDNIRHIAVADNDGDILITKMKEGKTNLKTDDEEQRYVFQLCQIRGMYDITNEKLGNSIFSYTAREQIHQFVFYTQRNVVYLTCEKSTDDNTLIKISKNVHGIIKKFMEN